MRIRVHAAVIVLTFVPALALVGVPRSALGSPGANDGGTLIVHATFPVEYTSDGDYCGLAGLDDCRDAVIRSDQAAPIVGHVIAAFPRGSIPRLKGIVFGLDYDPGITLLGFASCGDFELPQGDWPAAGSGTAVTWSEAQTSELVEVYWFGVYAEGSEPGRLELIAHPAHGGFFADDQVPSVLDPIAGFGALGFSSDGFLPCPEPRGACCFEDGHCTALLMDDCEMAGGVPLGEGVLCEPNPCPQPPSGACCFSDGACLVLSAPECTGAEGMYQGDDTSCDPNPCPQPTGACCFPDGSCQTFTADACAGAAGLYQGDHTLCDPNPCPLPTGACCLDDGSCRLESAESCGIADGVYLGDDTTCDPNPCPQPFGACCFSGQLCLILTPVECAAEGGSYQGNDLSCDPNPCPPPTGACCAEDWFCHVLTAEECAASGGDYLGDESSCLPNPCCPDPVQGSGPATAEVGNGIGRLALGEETRDCGQFVINADDSYENGYTWQYDAVVAPYYGAFAECYAFHGVICSVVTDLTQIGGQNCQVMDVYVWRDAAGVPGAVLYTRQVEPGPVAFWPEVSRHTFWVQYYESSDVAWAGFWGAWPGGPSGWFVAADTNGFGGCPSTNIAPGIGYPTGWNNVSIVWGPTQALGIGAEVMDGDPVPSIETSWGHIKSLFR